MSKRSIDIRKNGTFSLERLHFDFCECFIPFPSLEGKYEVSSWGRILSKNRQDKKVKFMLPGMNKYGYFQYFCTSGDVRKHGTYHRLIATLFIPNPRNLSCVNHIDGNKLNNNVLNLEWCSNRYNRDHAISLGLINNKGIRNPSSKLCDDDVVSIRRKKLKGDSSYLLAKEYNVTYSCIHKIITNKTWKHI